jgi:hypothetical protein
MTSFQSRSWVCPSLGVREGGRRGTGRRRYPWRLRVGRRRTRGRANARRSRRRPGIRTCSLHTREAVDTAPRSCVAHTNYLPWRPPPPPRSRKMPEMGAQSFRGGRIENTTTVRVMVTSPEEDRVVFVKGATCFCFFRVFVFDALRRRRARRVSRSRARDRSGGGGGGGGNRGTSPRRAARRARCA